MDFAAAKVGCFAQKRVAHDIEVGIARQPEAVAQRRAATFFDVHKELQRVAHTSTGEHRENARRGLFITRTKTVRPAVEGVKVRMRLKDKIGLAREPESRALEVRKH